MINKRFFAAMAATAACGLSLFPQHARSASPAGLGPAPVAAESFDVGALHVDRYGGGKQALILIPGLGSGPWSWYGTIRHFEPQFTIYALTLPGFDGRPATPQRPAFAAFERDFDRLLTQRAIETPIVVGHSLGGTLAIVLGEREPGRLRAIVAVDGLPVFPGLSNVSGDQRKAAATMAAQRMGAQSYAAELASDQQYMSQIGTIDPALVDPTAALEAKSDPKAVAAWMQEDLASDFRPELSRITVPLLEIMPYYAPDHNHPPLQYTQAQSVAFYQSLLTGAPRATVVPIPNARHFVMLDQPQAFYNALDTFIAGLAQ